MFSLYQFNDVEISKEHLLKQKYIELLYINEPFVVDTQIIALFDVSEYHLKYGNTLIVHAKYGVFFDVRTTKQLMNEFYLINGVGFASSRAIADFFDMTHYMPFISAYISYMPMTGGSRKNVDWVALHWIKKYSQIQKSAAFITVQGFKIRFGFPRGDLNNRIHDVCVMNEKSIGMFQTIVHTGLAELQPPAITGVVVQHKNCGCELHKLLHQKLHDVNHTFSMIRNFVFTHLDIESINPELVIQYYYHNLARLSKLC